MKLYCTDGTLFDGIPDDDILINDVTFPCGLVEAFETFLCFLEAAGENTDLFPSYVVEWAAAQTYLEEARSSICDENGDVLHHLIKE